MKKKTSTHEIMNNFNNTQSAPLSPEEINFIDITDERNNLIKDIKHLNYSINSLATKTDINSSQLSLFLKGKKKLGRNKMLSLCIVLGYNIQKTQQILTRFQLPALYPKNIRDYYILTGIKSNNDLTTINNTLTNNQLETLGE